MPEIEQSSLITSAWLLAVSESFNIAVAEVVVAEYILGSEVKLVPGSIEHCNQVLTWRSDFVPVIDMSVLLGGQPLDCKHIAVVAYQEYEGQHLRYVALKLYSGIEQIQVSDGTMCEMPETFPEIMLPIVDSVFMQQDKLVSVINIADLCNQGYRDYLLAMRRYQDNRMDSAV